MNSSNTTTTGHVYLVAQQIGAVRLHKIGITADLDRRMRQLANPEIVHTVQPPNHEEIEAELHRRFDQFRWPQSEWFNLTEAQVAEVVEAMDEMAPDHVAEMRERARLLRLEAQALEAEADRLEREREARRQPKAPPPPPPEPEPSRPPTEAEIRARAEAWLEEKRREVRARMGLSR